MANGNESPRIAVVRIRGMHSIQPAVDGGGFGNRLYERSFVGSGFHPAQSTRFGRVVCPLEHPLECACQMVSWVPQPSRSEDWEPPKLSPSVSPATPATHFIRPGCQPLTRCPESTARPGAVVRCRCSVTSAGSVVKCLPIRQPSRS